MAAEKYLGSTAELRGTTAVVEGSFPGETLRGSSASLRGTQYGELDDGNNEAIGIVGDLRSTFKYARSSFLDHVLRRDGRRALDGNAVAFSPPKRTALRHTMIPAANSYRELRRGSSPIGDTVAAALRGSYSARARLERAQAARLNVNTAMSAFLPKVSSVINANLGGDNNNISGFSNGSRVTGGLQVSMQLFTSGVNLNRYREAKHLSAAADYSYLAEEHRVALQAVAAHINLRLNRKVEGILARNLKAMKRMAYIAHKRFEAGDASRTDIALAQANVASARADLDLARKSREEIESDFQTLTGQSVPSKLKLPRVERFIPPTRGEALAIAMRRNPQLASSQHAAIASRHAARAERGRYGPQVNLTGNVNRDLYRNQGSRQNAWNIGVQLTIPLFDLSVASSVGAARHTALEAEFNALDQGRLLEKQLGRSWAAYHSALRRVDIVRSQVGSLAKSVEGARREYQAGFRSIADVLNDQVRLARAQITLQQVRHERLLAGYEIAFSISHPGIVKLAAR